MAFQQEHPFSLSGPNEKQQTTFPTQVALTKNVLHKERAHATFLQKAKFVDQELFHHTLQALSDNERNPLSSLVDNAGVTSTLRGVSTSTLSDLNRSHSKEFNNVVAQRNALVCEEPKFQHSKPDDCLSPDVWLTPPQPLDLRALHETWEKVMAYKKDMKSNKSEMSFRKPDSVIKVLHPRNVRIARTRSQQVNDLFAAQCATAKALVEKDTNILERLEKGGLWINDEIPGGDVDLVDEINHLKQDRSTSESQWSMFLQQYFFRKPVPRKTYLMKETERRQLHSFSLDDVKGLDKESNVFYEEIEEIFACMDDQNDEEGLTETNEEEMAGFDEEKIETTQERIRATLGKEVDEARQEKVDTTENEVIDESVVEERYPPIEPDFKTGNRKSVPMPDRPWIHNKQKRGYVYTDILYAAAVKWFETRTFREDIRDFPTLRIFPDSNHLGGWIIVEIKPFRLTSSSSKSRKPKTAYYGHEAALGHALRYGTLAAAVMLHEKLKLCYMSSQDGTSFSVEKVNDLNVHFIAAIGPRMYHYIHCLRPKIENGPVVYETHFLGEYDLAAGEEERQEFRNTLNLLHVYHATKIRDMELTRIRNVLDLGKAEIQSRLRSRTHRWIQFFYTERENVFSAKDISPANKASKQLTTSNEDAKGQVLPAPPTNSVALLTFPSITEEETSISYRDSQAFVNRAANEKVLCNSTATTGGIPCKNRAVASNGYQYCHLSSHQPDH